ncbi:MAG: cupredoxin domain-containing protein [Gemmatimonadales bacterium]
MSLFNLLVLLGGLAATLFVIWWFLVVPRRRAALAPGVAVAPGSEVVIAVRGGYQPDVVRVPAGKPVRLVFDRQEDSSCSEELVISQLGVRRFLPAFARTTVGITAPAPGTYEITCGMGMLHGRLIAE